MCIYLNYHFFGKVESTLHGLLVVNNENNSMIKIRLIDSTQACLGEGANDRDHLFFAEYILTYKPRPPSLPRRRPITLAHMQEGARPEYYTQGALMEFK